MESFRTDSLLSSQEKRAAAIGVSILLGVKTPSYAVGILRC